MWTVPLSVPAGPTHDAGPDAENSNPLYVFADAVPTHDTDVALAPHAPAGAASAAAAASAPIPVRTVFIVPPLPSPVRGQRHRRRDCSGGFGGTRAARAAFSR